MNYLMMKIFQILLFPVRLANRFSKIRGNDDLTYDEIPPDFRNMSTPSLWDDIDPYKDLR